MNVGLIPVRNFAAQPRREASRKLPQQEFSRYAFFFGPGDLISQTLNFMARLFVRGKVSINRPTFMPMWQSYAHRVSQNW